MKCECAVIRNGQRREWTLALAPVPIHSNATEKKIMYKNCVFTTSSDHKTFQMHYFADGKERNWYGGDAL